MSCLCSLLGQTTSTNHHFYLFNFSLKLLLAKASYRSAIRMARDVIQDIGEEAAASSEGLLQLGQISEHHPERGGHTLVSKKAGLCLPVPLTPLGEDDLELPILRLRDWCQFLADKHCLHILVGLQYPNLRRESLILEEFWRVYRQVEPNHEIFQWFDDGRMQPACAYPAVYRGDEGRGRRRQAFYTSSWHSLLGKGTLQQLKESQSGPFLKLNLNFRGNSLTTRMLHCACPKKLFSKPGVFQALMASAAARWRHCPERTACLRCKVRDLCCV